MSSQAHPGGSRLLPIVIPLALLFGAAAGALYRSSDARDVALEAAGLVLTFFSTPFVLETMVALLGLVALLAWNRRCEMEREKDEWVVMEVPAKPAEADAGTAAQ